MVLTFVAFNFHDDISFYFLFDCRYIHLYIILSFEFLEFAVAFEHNTFEFFKFIFF